MLIRNGYDVLSTDSPLRALEIVRDSAPIDLVLSDVYMPEIQGTQLIHKIAQISPQTSFVLMTGSPIMSASIWDNVPVLRETLFGHGSLFHRSRNVGPEKQFDIKKASISDAAVQRLCGGFTSN